MKKRKPVLDVQDDLTQIWNAVENKELCKIQQDHSNQCPTIPQQFSGFQIKCIDLDAPHVCMARPSFTLGEVGKKPYHDRTAPTPRAQKDQAHNGKRLTSYQRKINGNMRKTRTGRPSFADSPPWTPGKGGLAGSKPWQNPKGRFSNSV